MRTHQYVYARWYQNEVEPMLFDIQADPYEMNNLYGKKECASVQADMEQKLQDWIARTGDPFETGERDPESGMLKLGQKYIHEKWNYTKKENF